MRIYDNKAGVDFLLDELPQVYNPAQCVFFTHLVHLNGEILTFPRTRMPKIYTSAALAKQFIDFCAARRLLLDEGIFHIFTPFQPATIQLHNDTTVVVLPCEEDEDVPGRKLMLLFRQNGKLTHFYAGICTALRRSLLSPIFVEWTATADGVPKLYLNLTNWSAQQQDHTSVMRTQATVDKIEALLNEADTLVLIIPIFGYEHLISQLTRCFRGRIAIAGNYYDLELNADDLHQTRAKAKIVITNQRILVRDMAIAYDLCNCLTILISGAALTTTEHDGHGYRELQWSPLPGAFELRLMATLLRPTHIVDSSKAIIAVASDLAALCRVRHSPKKEQKRTTYARRGRLHAVNVTPTDASSGTPKTNAGKGEPQPRDQTTAAPVSNTSPHTMLAYRRHKQQLVYDDDNSNSSHES